MIKYLGLGLAAAALLAGLFFFANRGSQVRLEGSIVKVRTIATDTNSSLIILEIRLKNPARTRFVIDSVEVEVTPPGGPPVTGRPIAEADLDRALDYYKTAGPRYNPMLKLRDRMAADEAGDKTVAAGFALPETALQNRRALLVRLVDVDGAVTEIR